MNQGLRDMSDEYIWFHTCEKYFKGIRRTSDNKKEIKNRTKDIIPTEEILKGEDNEEESKGS